MHLMRLLCALPLICPPVLASQQTTAAPASPDLAKAAEEFKVQTRNYGLRPDSPPSVRGRARSSQAKWHGRLFENFRNDFLDAIPHEIQQRGGTKSLLRRNQFGFNLAGPVAFPRYWGGLRDTWFSVSYEGMRERISRSSLRTIPTGPERLGDFSATVDASGNPLPIYDSLSTRANPAYAPRQPVSTENLQYLRSPFPSNTIPSIRLDPVARNALDYYPLPNTDVGPFFRNNYFVVSPETNTAGGMLAKVDHTLNERHRFEASFSFSDGFAGAARLFDTIADSGPADRTYANRRGAVEHTYTRSARTIHNVSFAAVTDQNSLDREGTANSVDQIGLKGPLGLAFPYLRFLPYLSMGRPQPVSHTARNTFEFNDGLSLKRGKHAFRMVNRFDRYQVNTFLPPYPAGAFRFGAGLTSLPGINNTGHAFASFVLGLAEYSEASLVESPSYFRRSMYLVALRDTWDVFKGLTFSFAFNIETSTPRVEKYDRQATVDLEAINPENRRPGALVFANRNGYGRAFQPVQFRGEPSASLSWNPLGDLRTVVRLYYGRSYQALPIYSAQWATQGFVGAPTVLSQNVQLEPALKFRDGFPEPSYPLPDLRPEGANDTVADLMDRGSTAPTFQSYGLSIERAVPGSVVITVGTGHSQGRNMFISNSSADPNAIPLSALAARDRLNDETFNRSLRPYPQYRGFDVYSSWPLGRYQRDAGYVRMEKRSSKGLTMTAYYEFSKQMDDYSGPYGTQDFYNRHNEWSLTAYNIPHRFSVNYVYELPIGANKLLFAFSDWRRHLVDGWSVSGMSSVLSGEPLALRPMFNNTGGVVSTLNVNVVPGADPAVANRGPDQWFNPAAFDQPSDFTIGDASRTHPKLLNPGFQNHDLSLTKRFAIGTERTVEFSAVGFNFLNQGNWDNPDTLIGPASSPNVNAGKIISSRGGRVVQLGLRFSF